MKSTSPTPSKVKDMWHLSDASRLDIMVRRACTCSVNNALVPWVRRSGSHKIMKEHTAHNKKIKKILLGGWSDVQEEGCLV